MKRTITILAMLLIAATAYNQTSRRSASREETATQNERTSTTRTRSASSTSSSTARTKSAGSTDSRSSNREATSSSRSSDRDRQATTSRSSQSRSTSEPSRSSSTTTSRSQTQSRTSEAPTRAQSHTTGTTSRSHSVDRTTYHVNNSRSSSATVRSSGRHVYSSPRVYRERHTVVHHHHAPKPRAYRAEHYAYRAPVNVYVVWTPSMHRHYQRMYPSVRHWHYSHGYHIEMVSSYFADYYTGEVMTVYGKVSEVYYSRATDEYFLYYGPHYPYQDFTLVVPGHLARKYSHRPSWFFENQYIAATGLITSFEGEPEIVVRESFQLSIY